MRNKGIWKMLAVSVVLAIVASTVAVFSAMNLDKGIDEGGGKGITSLEMPPFIGIAGASESEVRGMREGANFLEEEAGACAYTKLTPPVNLTLVKTAFKTVEYACGDYIIGSVAVSDVDDEDVHVYVSRDGWIAAYYLEEEPFPKILKNMMDFRDNKLGDALQKVCDALWVSLPEVNYYDFRYPNANKVQIVADEVSDSSDSFRFMIPKEVAANVSKVYWVVIGKSGWTSLYLDGKVLGRVWGEKYGELMFAQPGVPGNIVPGDYRNIKITSESCGNGGILLIYKE